MKYSFFFFQKMCLVTSTITTTILLFKLCKKFPKMLILFETNVCLKESLTAYHINKITIINVR